MVRQAKGTLSGWYRDTRRHKTQTICVCYCCTRDVNMGWGKEIDRLFGSLYNCCILIDNLCQRDTYLMCYNEL